MSDAIARRALRTFTTMLLALVTTIWVVLVTMTVNDSAGRDAEATIVAIRSDYDHRHVFTAQFVTTGGVTCHSEFDSGRTYDVLPPIHVGDRVMVHYPAYRPCGYARAMETGNGPVMAPVAIASVFFVISLVLNYLSWRRPDRLLMFLRRGKRRRSTEPRP